MRSLSDAEIESIKRLDPVLLGRVSIVMSRIDFIDELRYSVNIDLTNIIECNHRNALETYLLCTCFDTLSGKDNYEDLQSWLKTKKSSIYGVSERNTILNSNTLSIKSFSSLIDKILEIYNSHYGVNKNINLLITSLPNNIKATFVNEFTVVKQSWKTTWQNRTVDEKLKVIFVEYLFNFRRNRYTHESKTFPTFGGICLMRENLLKGIIELPDQSTLNFPHKSNYYEVTCHYGDEALFMREFLFACLAKKLGVLSNEWRNLYRHAESQKRVLYALFYEIKHNIQVIQSYLEILLEPLILFPENGKTSSRFKTKVAQLLLESASDISLPIDSFFLESYVQAALQLNDEIDNLQEKRASDQVLSFTRAITNSDFRLHTQILGRRCIQLLNDYPEWIYSNDYSLWTFSI